jgi:hypothetical protein
MSSFKEYKITFGGKEYALESDDGGKSGSVYEIGADRWDISYAYLYEDTGVQRRASSKYPERASMQPTRSRCRRLTRS